METKLDREWMENIRDQCGFKHGIIVPSIHRSGGLVLFWKDDIKVNLLKYSLSNIDVKVFGGERSGWWHLTGFYGNPVTAKRMESWSLLKHLSGLSQLPWLMIGDFNEIKNLSKKEGGASRPAQLMQRFVDTVNWCGLRDLGFIGPKFTWLY